MKGMLLLGMLAACGARSSYVSVDGVALGRVVVYRNGVAYYERRATVTDGQLTVRVPRDRVDDFLKSLTVVDAISRAPLPVSIPRRQDDGATLVMKLQLPRRATADVLLTYVTEAPAWKPSYRVVVGDKGKVMLEGWAIVDNTSGEDWKGVVVGVGSSSALSFRYDLWSVRTVQREELRDRESFAIAPPTGVSPYSADDAGELVVELDHRTLDAPAVKTEVAVRHRRLLVGSRDEARRQAELEKRLQGVGISEGVLDTPSIPEVPESLVRSNRRLVIESHVDARSGSDPEKVARDRANAVRDRLIDRGVAAKRITIVTRSKDATGDHLRVVAQPAGPDEARPAPPPADITAAPVGEAHFASPTPMTIERGASAMVAMVRGETDGEVVYLYDAERARGNDHFAFRAVRFRNPTRSTLETGPVTVYGDGRFIGEGLTEPIPPNESAVVPYALDRQIVVERTDADEDRIHKVVTVQRGVLTAQVQRIKRKQLAITNRLGTPARVFVRHGIQKGWSLVGTPPAFERVGDAYLFSVEVPPRAVGRFEIAEAMPLERELDLGVDPTLAMLRVFVDAPHSDPELAARLRKVVGAHRELADLTNAQTSLRVRLADYKARMDELHAQLVSLQAVKTGNDLIAHLKTKMRDISDRVQKTTIAIVDHEEKIMLARVRFSDLIADL